jgi:hypothetical protein
MSTWFISILFFNLTSWEIKVYMHKVHAMMFTFILMNFQTEKHSKKFLTIFGGTLCPWIFPLFKNEEYASTTQESGREIIAYLQVNSPSLSEGVGGTSNIMITFNSCFMMSWKQESRTFPKGKAKTQLSAHPQPLIFRMAHPRALPYTVLLSAFIVTYIFTPPRIQLL